MPLVNISISTEPSTLDLEGIEPMVIKLALRLDHTTPITFRKSESSLFDGSLLYESGLAFTNANTGKPVKRGSINVCTFGSDEYLTADTFDAYATLVPGREEFIETRIEPSKMDSDLVALMKPSGGKLWHGGQGLEKGSQYEIGISAKTLARVCVEGTREQLLQSLEPGTTLEDVAIAERVPLAVISTARFECKD